MPPWKLAVLLLIYIYGGIEFTLGFCAKELISYLLKAITKKEESSQISQKEDEDTKESEADSISSIEEPSRNKFLLSTQFRPVLLNILNKCEPESFVRISLTCKDMRTVCLNSKGIRIDFPCKIVWTNGVTDDLYIYGPCVRFKYLHEEEGSRVIYGRQLENLKRLPFHFKMHIRFKGYYLTEKDIDRVFGFIRKFPKFSISKMFITEDAEVDCWPQFLDYFKEFRVGHLIENSMYMNDVTLKSLLQLNFDALDVHRNILRGMMWMIGAKTVFIKGSNVSAEEFKDFLRHISQDEVPHLNRWHFRGLHSSLLSPDAFKKCFDEFTPQIPFADEGVLPTTRPLISFYYDGSCYMLTRANAVVKFSIVSGMLSIRAVRYCEFTVTDLPRLFRPFFAVDE